MKKSSPKQKKSSALKRPKTRKGSKVSRKNKFSLEDMLKVVKFKTVDSGLVAGGIYTGPSTIPTMGRDTATCTNCGSTVSCSICL